MKHLLNAEGKLNVGKSILTWSFRFLASPGITPVDGAPHRPYSECYPVLLDGVMVGWADKELVPGIADSLRHFKVILSLCELFCPSVLGFQSFSSCWGSPRAFSSVKGSGGQKLITKVPIHSLWWQRLALYWRHQLGSVTGIWPVLFFFWWFHWGPSLLI